MQKQENLNVESWQRTALMTWQVVLTEKGKPIICNEDHLIMPVVKACIASLYESILERLQSKELAAIFLLTTDLLDGHQGSLEDEKTSKKPKRPRLSSRLICVHWRRYMTSTTTT